MTAAAVPETVLMGRCVTCRRPFRITVPLTFKYPGRVWHSSLLAAGVEPPLCPCAEHGRGEVWWTPLTVEYKPEVLCSPGGGGCWTARNSKCRCSCRGANHGGMYALTRTEPY
mgnify:CR=1 FL=1